VSKTIQCAAEVASQRAHIGALAAFGGEHAVIAIGHIDEFKAMNRDRAGLELHNLAVTGQIICALALDLDRGEARRHLLDRAGEARNERADCLQARPLAAGRGDATLSVVGVALLAPANREAIDLASFHHEGNCLGRLSERDRQEARGERIERPGVPGTLGRK